MMLPVLVVLALAAPLAPAEARRHPPGLREDEPARRTTRPAECQFDKQAKELGSTWFADLGPPFGVMYCIKCECVPVQKKRRVVAKVHCRNIKKDCPEPTCDAPVLLPGRCCKSCPGDENSPDIVQEDSPSAVVAVEEEEYNMKHFGALLTGRSPLCIRRDDMTGVPVAPGVATARFTFRRRHLYWSVLLGTSMAQPRAISFLDRAGRMLLEHPIKKSPGIHATYEDKTDKLCGVWRRVPRDYKRLLREGSLYVALIWGNEQNSTMDSALSGRISRYPALSSEMFTSLLEPENLSTSITNSVCDGDTRIPNQDAAGWWGGTAVVTAAAGAAPSLHVAVLYNGIFSSVPREQGVRILLTLPDKNQTIIDEVQKASKPSSELNILEVSTPISSAELRPLVRSRLLLTVEAVDSPERRILGIVRQKATCEVYHAPLLTERAPASLAPEGLALIYIDKEGSLVYDIQVDDLEMPNPKITLEEEQSKRQVEIMNTWSGVLVKPSARIFPPLYDDQLAVHISADTGPPILRGRLTSRPLPDSAGSGPALLKRTNARVPATVTPLAGLAWISVDALCGMHYEVVVTGNQAAWSAWLETHPVEGATGAGEIGAGGEARALTGAEGCVLEPSQSELVALQAGASYLELRATDNDTALLRTRLPQISVPSSCLPAEMTGTDNRQQLITTTPYNSIFTASCFYAGRYYEDGAQWMSTESCHMCGCAHGTTHCDPVRCPNVTCSVPTTQPPGQCCPICTNSTTAVWNESHGCHLAGQYHAPGSSWHPYLVPRGYDTCAVCTCEFSTRQVRCDRVRCPPLRCAEREAYRPDKKSCCRVCPEERANKTEEETPRDQGTPRTAEEILAEGGCKFPDGPLPNGKEAHPSIHSHGEQRCVTCRCKDGELSCVRKRCGRAACSRRGGGARAPADPCCVCSRRRRPRAPPSRRAPLRPPS